ncbi:MAG: alpha-galactosidase [Gaiellaceae bacterium]
MLAVAALWAPAAARADVYARVTPTSVVLGNELVERTWSRAQFETTALVDKRTRTWSRNQPDFTLNLGAPVSSDAFHVDSASVTKLPRGGRRVSMELSGFPGLTVTRMAEAYPGIAGFRTQTILHPSVPLSLSGAALDQAAVGKGTATANAFHAGSDWRDVTKEDFRTPSQDPDAPGEWLTVQDGNRSLFMVTERNDLPSSRDTYDGNVAAAKVDYTRDVISLGPFEENAHAENPVGTAGRQRLLTPGEDLALDPVFTGFGDHPGDDAWQYHQYLGTSYPHAVVFNSDGTDSNRISTGSKDDMDYATVQQDAPIARKLGVETFVLDDGWAALDGDWEPDPSRFPDQTFDAVRKAIAPMRLGLWMSPTEFNPQAKAYKDHPDWGCAPTGDATAAYNLADPSSGSNEAGIGAWGPAAFPYVESRIRDAIDHWGVTYFKFDFMVWLDCAGQGDLYDYEDAFVAMIDRLRRDHPEVTFQIDDTNDYRLFPFASVTRGPTWFQNGRPDPGRLLHNLWILAPYVPGFAVGQHMLGGDTLKHFPVATLMAAALPSHMTYIDDLRTLPPAVVDEAAQWISLYTAHRDELGGVLYPLLDDPLKNGWTALQSWDPDAGRGAVLAFRQGAAAETRRIALQNVTPGRSFDLFEAPTGAYAGTVTSVDLEQGIDVSVPAPNGAKVLLVEPAARR